MTIIPPTDRPSIVLIATDLQPVTGWRRNWQIGQRISATATA
jgi:hypothetical protein